MQPFALLIGILLASAHGSSTQGSTLDIQASWAGKDIGTKSTPISEGAQQVFEDASGTVKLTLALNPDQFVRQVPLNSTQTAICILVERAGVADPNLLQPVGQPCMVVDADSKHAELSWSHEALALTFTYKAGSN